MSTFAINPTGIVNNNSYYGFYGNGNSLPLGTLPFDPWVIVDGDDTDKALPSGTFAYNNDKPVAGRYSTELSNTNNNALFNMDNTTLSPSGYPGQDEFGKEQTYQYIYSANPRKDRIGVF